MFHLNRAPLTEIAAQINVIQNLTYFEHLSEPMAEFLHILAETYDYPQLADEILREISNKEFNSNDTRGPKSVSTFIAKLSELAPRLVIKQMTMLAKQLDSEVGHFGASVSQDLTNRT
jgi:condensin complex subunit 1